MQAAGVGFLRECVPTRLSKNDDGTITVIWKSSDGEEKSETFDTVLFAIGKNHELKESLLFLE